MLKHYAKIYKEIHRSIWSRHEKDEIQIKGIGHEFVKKLERKRKMRNRRRRRKSKRRKRGGRGREEERVHCRRCIKENHEKYSPVLQQNNLIL